MERGLYQLCKEYFEKNFNKSGVDREGRKDIFQSTLLALWENIRNKKLYVEGGELRGKDGGMFTSALTTYFMGIANNKYLEWKRKNPVRPPLESVKGQAQEVFLEEDVAEFFSYDDEMLRTRAVLSQRIAHLAKQCNRILTLFYYEEKDYDEIMLIMPSFTSRDALKTAKYKCLKRLRNSVTGSLCNRTT